jgi:hypothetical protein
MKATEKSKIIMVTTTRMIGGEGGELLTTILPIW